MVAAGLMRFLRCRSMTTERELVQQFGLRGLEADALRGLAGGVTATHLRTVTLTDSAFEAVTRGVTDPNPRVRWWCIQILDHVPDPRAVRAIAGALRDAVPRVRRNAAHALGCIACKPDWDGALPEDITEELARLAAADPSEKVRHEAALALACRTDT